MLLRKCELTKYDFSFESAPSGRLGYLTKRYFAVIKLIIESPKNSSLS